MKTKQHMNLILASESPRRRELLSHAGYTFDVVSPPMDEPMPETDAENDPVSPAAHAEALAYFKARSITKTQPETWILAADTICCLGSELLGKASGADEARTMLRKLSTHPHQVITGVALLGPEGQRIIASDITHVFMRPMTEEEIQDYIASGEWIGKAGAYAIQETADRFVERIEGSFTNVVGLPMELLEEMLKKTKGFFPREK